MKFLRTCCQCVHRNVHLVSPDESRPCSRLAAHLRKYSRYKDLFHRSTSQKLIKFRIVECIVCILLEYLLTGDGGQFGDDIGFLFTAPDIITEESPKHSQIIIIHVAVSRKDYSSAEHSPVLQEHDYPGNDRSCRRQIDSAFWMRKVMQHINNQKSTLFRFQYQMRSWMCTHLYPSQPLRKFIIDIVRRYKWFSVHDRAGSEFLDQTQAHTRRCPYRSALNLSGNHPAGFTANFNHCAQCVAY